MAAQTQAARLTPTAELLRSAATPVLGNASSVWLTRTVPTPTRLTVTPRYFDVSAAPVTRIVRQVLAVTPSNAAVPPPVKQPRIAWLRTLATTACAWPAIEMSNAEKMTPFTPYAPRQASRASTAAKMRNVPSFNSVTSCPAAASTA